MFMNSPKYILILKKEILGTDMTFINQEGFKINDKISLEFCEFFSLNKKQSEYNKSVFTICDYRENESVLHGRFKQKRCCMIIRKRFITTMQS